MTAGIVTNYERGDRVKREVGGGIRMGNTCKSMADSFQCMAKPLQCCEVISLQLIKINGKKKEKKWAHRKSLPLSIYLQLTISCIIKKNEGHILSHINKCRHTSLKTDWMWRELQNNETTQMTFLVDLTY